MIINASLSVFISDEGLGIYIGIIRLGDYTVTKDVGEAGKGGDVRPLMQ